MKVWIKLLILKIRCEFVTNNSYDQSVFDTINVSGTAIIFNYVNKSIDFNSFSYTINNF
jgi:hypothetical protein